VATDLRTGGAVVVKELSLAGASDWKAVDLFRREAAVLASLDHPRIPRYVDHFEREEGTELFLVQTYVQGRPLAELLLEPWSVGEPEARRVAAEVLEILAYLQQHPRSVVHRDLKPSNLILGDDGHLYLVDFGAVRDVVRTAGDASTIVGTLGYMAPEQVFGRADGRTDLYGLGATLVHLLSGRPPSDLPLQGLSLDLRAAVRVSEPLLCWLERMVAPDPEARFSSATAALAALEGRATAVASDAPPPGSGIVRRREGGARELTLPALGFASRHSARAALAAAGCWALAALISGLVAQRGPAFLIGLLIPLWAVAFWLGVLALWAAARHVRLLLTADRYRIEYRLLTLRHAIEGDTEDLLSVSTTQSPGWRSTKLESRASAHPIAFGRSALEHDWLEREIKLELKALRLRRGR
jgi:hypothetical protein